MVAMDRTTGIQRLGAALLALRWMCEQHSPQGGRHGKEDGYTFSEREERKSVSEPLLESSGGLRSRSFRGFAEGKPGLEERSFRAGRCALFPGAEAQLASLRRAGNVSGRPAICFERRNAWLEAAQRRWRSIGQVAVSASIASFWLRSNSNLLRSSTKLPGRIRALISGALHWHDPVSVRVSLRTRQIAKNVRSQFMPRHLGHCFNRQDVACSDWPAASAPLRYQRGVNFEQARECALPTYRIDGLLDRYHGLCQCVHAPNIAVLFTHVNSIAVRLPEHLQIASLYA